MSRGIQVMSDICHHLVPSHKDYVTKSVILCNYIAGLSSTTSVEDDLFYYQIMEGEFNNFEGVEERDFGTGWEMHVNS